jgi:hypothetical protein
VAVSAEYNTDRNVTVVAELDRRAGGVWKLRTPVLSHEREHFIGTSEIEAAPPPGEKTRSRDRGGGSNPPKGALYKGPTHSLNSSW